MISISRATAIVTRETGGLVSERIAIEHAVGRVLAENILADTDLPPFDRSQMDGYAVIAAETKNAPVTLKIVGESAAGRGWHQKIEKGEAVRIMTGAPVPAGADAVQRLELTSEAGGTVTVREPVKKGAAIVHKGAEIKKGKVVIRAGELITPNNIATTAAFGYAKLKVAKRPRVGILATGSEIVSVTKKPARDQIRNSNSVMLKALAEAAGAECEIFSPAGDELADLRSQISNSVKRKDILIITGGVSVGKYDLTKTALADLGAEIFIEKLDLKPGKPMVWVRVVQNARLRSTRQSRVGGGHFLCVCEDGASAAAGRERDTSQKGAGSPRVERKSREGPRHVSAGRTCSRRRRRLDRYFAAFSGLVRSCRLFARRFTHLSK